jgi:hypothetical protein
LVVKSALFVPLITPAVKVIGAPLVLVIVTVEETCTPTFAVPKFTDDGVNSTPVPVPASATVWGLVASLSDTLNVPVTYPRTVGVNVTNIEQVPPAATGNPFVQVVARVLANGPVSDRAGLPSVRVAPVLFVRVILVVALVVPIAWPPNVTELGVNATPLVPVPVIPTNCGLPGSLSLITREPFFAPAVCGLNTTLIVQLALAARGLPAAGQVLAEIPKSVFSFKLIVPIVMLLALLLVLLITHKFRPQQEAEFNICEA